MQKNSFTYLGSYVLFTCLILSQSAFALEIDKSSARKISILGDKLTLYKQESLWFGISCQSSVVGSITSVKELSLGDTVELSGERFKIGVIAVNEMLEDVEVLGRTITAKGDVVCMAASDDSKLPSAEGCQSVWLHIAECGVLEAL